MADEAPGWEAIDAACRQLHGTQTPKHVGYPPGVHLGAGLQGCSAYDADDHWHYVTYGLTELWAKEEGADPEVSGWGYELTMRVVKAGPEPEGWPFNELEFIARHTRTRGHPFRVGDRIDRERPIGGLDQTRLTAFAVLPDPELVPMTTPNGSFEFRQLVGITADELTEMRATSTEAVLNRLRRASPKLVTDPRR